MAFCLGDLTRTSDLLVPNQVRYQLRHTQMPSKGIAKIVIFSEKHRLSEKIIKSELDAKADGGDAQVTDTQIQETAEALADL